jgi:DNA-binding transcriptional MerR regulator
MKPTLKLEPLPEIPRKRYFAIGEVSDLCGVKAHVLRYWEQEFPQLRPAKRRGNRRYYQQDDVLMIRRIRSLLYEQGYTIGAARLRLKEQSRSNAIENIGSISANDASAAAPLTMRSSKLEELARIRLELEELLQRWPV